MAFCCISTGVFGFPAKDAARIAVKTVQDWLDDRESAGKEIPVIVFNVFLDSDEDIYKKILGSCN